MNPMQMFQAMMQQGNNPVFQRAMQMAQGKNEGEIKEIVKNLASQRGMNMQQLNSLLAQFGMKL